MILLNVPHGLLCAYTIKIIRNEDKDMKRRIATLLTLALSTTLLLGGCGGSSDTETTNNNSTNSSSGILSEITKTKSNLLSECLSEEKVIGYVVDSVDKAETPKKIYFFNDGKVTIIPGKEFGLTMGDFAKMSDDEIWQKLETVKTSYIENYVDAEMEQSINNAVCQEVCNVERGYSMEYDYDTLQGIYAGLEDDMAIENYGGVMFEYYFGSVEDEINRDEINEKEESFWSRGQTYTDAVSFLKELAEATKQKKEELSYTYKGPFFDIPFAFSVETDTSGNNVQSESLIYPTLVDSFDIENIEKFYDSLNFALGLTRQQDIYDTTYNCIELSNSGSFLTREAMDIDTLESNNIKIDLTSDEMNELFKAEVMSRYE